MKAFIVIPEPNDLWRFLGHDQTPVMLPFLDRSMLQHVVETVVTLGAKKVAVAPLSAADAIHRLLRDGQRWGIGIQISPMQSANQLATLVKSFGGGEPVLVVNGERLPDIDAIHAGQAAGEGWRVVTSDEELDTSFLHETNTGVNVATPEAYVASWGHFVNDDLPAVVRTGRSRGDQVVVGRGARVHPTAQLIGPVYIGERSLISAGCTVGPNGFVGSDCILEDKVVVSEGVALTHTYLGASIELRRKIARNGCVFDLDRQISLSAIEDFIVGSTKKPQAIRPGFPERLLGLGLGVVALPAAVVGLLIRPFMKRSDGSIGYESAWVDALCRVAPGFWSVAAGDRKIIGRPNMTPAQMSALNELSPGLTDSLAVGVLSDAYIQFGPNPTIDELWASLAFLAASGTLGTKDRVWTRYLARLYSR